MEIVKQRDTGRAASRRNLKQHQRPRSFIDIIFVSGVTNLALLACFFAGWNFEAIKAHVWPSLVEQNAVKSEDPLSDSRGELQDNELLTRGPQRQLKGPLQFTLVPLKPSEEPAALAEAEALLDAQPDLVGTADVSTPEQDQSDGSDGMTVGPEDPAAQLVKSPVLRKAQKSGEVEIGSFTTVLLPGTSSDCLDTAYGLLEDAGASRDKLKVLAETKLITVARICASNGSLVVTCRSDQVTISPRRLKPNETCSG